MTSSVLHCRIPDCSHWQDPRKGCYGRGSVKDRSSGDLFGAVDPDSDCEIRQKMFALLIVQAPAMGLGRIPARIFALLTGDFIAAGIHFAKKEWHLERQLWSLSGNRKGKPPGKCALYGKIIKHSLWQLIKNIVKIATYPIAIVGLQFAALYGLFNPLDGRKLWAMIEHAWSRDYIGEGWRWKDCDYLAPCMQPKRVWDQRNFYSSFSDPRTLRSLLLEIVNIVRENRVFFERENVDPHAMTKQFESFRKKVQRLSKKDHDETLNLQYGRSDKQAVTPIVREKLLNVRTLLHKIENQRRAVVIALTSQLQRVAAEEATLQMHKEALAEVLTSLDSDFHG